MSMSPDTEVEIGLAVLAVIEKAITEWQSVKSGKTNPDDVLNRLNAFTAQVDSNDKKADASVDAKFPK